MFVDNPRAVRAPYPAGLAALMNLAQASESRRWLSAWPGLARTATPLIELPGLARQLGVAQLCVKDESVRSPLASFKALGAPVALVRHFARLFPQLEATDILTGRYAATLAGHTVISATDGNHGRALAAAARDAGCPCVIVLHAHVSPEREQAIADLGARIVRVPGNYDDSVHEAARLAAVNGWQVISDTSYDGYEEIPRDVMQGYAIIALEVIEQTRAAADAPAPFTHVLLQGGVGGMAAGIASGLWEHFGAQRPCLIVVEPAQADCLQQSALQGGPARATGSVDSVMAGLACGETSPLAWRFLETSIDAFLTVSDDAAVQAMRTLARGHGDDMPLLGGESGVAGVAGLQALHDHPAWVAQVGMDADSRVLVINTEGATAPGVYAALVGETAESVLARQRAHLQRTVT